MNIQFRDDAALMPASPADVRDLLSLRPPRFLPRPVRELLKSNRLHPSILEALEPLSRKASIRIWDEAARDVEELPEALRSLEVRLARYLARVAVEPRKLGNGVWIGTELSLVGRGSVVSLAVRRKWHDTDAASLEVLRDHALRAARVELRQLIVAINGYHRPYCVEELMHADGAYDNFEAEAVQAWVKARADQLIEHVFAAARSLALKRPRQLQRAQAVPSLGTLVLHASSRNWKIEDEHVRQARLLLCESPLVLEWSMHSGVPAAVAHQALQTVPKSLARLVHRHLDKPLGPYPADPRHHGLNDVPAVAHDLASAIRLRSALLRAGADALDGYTKDGWCNTAKIIAAYRQIPGAEEVFADPGFVLGPLLRHGSRDLRDGVYERLGNTLSDTVIWTCGGDRGPWVAPALLAMTWSQLDAFSEAIHAEVRAQTTQRDAESGHTREFLSFMDPFVHGRYTLVDLSNSAALAEEGRRMSHCVASYDIAVSHRRSRIVSIRNAKGESRATLEICRNHGRYQQAQLAARDNARANASARQAATALIEALNSKTHRCNSMALVQCRDTYARGQETARLISDAWLREHLGPWLNRRPLALMRRWVATHDPSIA